MAQISPKTISEKILGQMEQAVATHSTYLSENGFEFRRLMRETDNLIGVDPFVGYSLRGLLHSLTGDVGHGLEALDKAARIDDGRDPGGIYFMRAQLYGKLGFYSKAIPEYIKSANIEYGSFGYRAAVGSEVGAYRFMSEQYAQAQEMRLELQETVDLNAVQEIAQIMKAIGITDEELAAYTDIAGEIVRNRRLIIKGYTKSHDGIGSEKILKIHFVVDCTPAERALMIFELAERFADLPSMPEGFHIGFEGLA